MADQGISTTAQFVFGLMGPDEKVVMLMNNKNYVQEQVNETAFYEYMRCVFALKARKNMTTNNLGLPTGSIYRTKVSTTYLL